MNHDVFISYRREGGIDYAGRLSDHLVAREYTPFLDLESMHSGRFDTQIYQRIDECEHFVLVLSVNALNRCKNSKDWVRNEVEYAIQKRKHIIPIFLPGFSFPRYLPKEMEVLRDIQSILSDPEDFANTVDKVVAFLRDDNWSDNEYDYLIEIAKKRIKTRSWSSILSVILLISVFSAGGYLYARRRMLMVAPDQEAVKWVVVNRNDIIYKDDIFLTEMQMRRLGEDNWYKTLDCEIGEEIEFQVHYRNGAYNQASDVMVRVSLPSNMEYIQDTAVLFNDLTGKDGQHYKDPTTEAVNIGNYSVYADGYLRFRTKIVNKSLERGKNNRLIPWAKISSNGEALQDSTQLYVEFRE